MPDSKPQTLERIVLEPTKPSIATHHADASTVTLLDEWNRKGQWNEILKLSVSSVSRIIYSFPNPALDGGDIAHLYYAAQAYEARGNKDRRIACLKALYSLEPYGKYLEDPYRSFISMGADQYRALSEEVGIERLNLIRVKETYEAGSPPTSGTDKGWCFIATACYGSYDAPEVLLLRRFRDNVLLKGKIGRLLVRIYYVCSPPAANFIARGHMRRTFVRLLGVAPIIKVIEKFNG